MFSYTSTNSIIISDRVVSKTNFGVVISPLSRLTKKNVDVSHIPLRTFGSKIKDNVMLGLVSDGILDFSQL
jgi:hypothetical protein